MPAYRDVDQRSLAQSIEKAISLLTDYSTGPEMAALLATFSTPDETGMTPLQRIETAPDKPALVQAVRDAQALSIFSRLREPLVYHTLFDTDGRGLEVMAALSLWGATNAGVRVGANPLKEEMEIWMAEAYASKTAFDAEHVDRIKAFFDRCAGDREAPIGLKTALYCIEKAAAGAHADIRAACAALTYPERRYTRLALKEATGINEEAVMMPLPGGVRTFGLVIGKSGEVDWNDKRVDAIIEKAEKVMEPYLETEDIARVMLGAINRAGDQSGVIFFAIRRVAEEIAAALPEHVIINVDGLRVQPRAANDPVPKKQNRAFGS